MMVSHLVALYEDKSLAYAELIAAELAEEELLVYCE